MKLTEQQARDIAFDGSEEFEIIEESDWVSQGKYDYSNIVFKDKNGDFFILNLSRCGSYFTDYEYDYELECPQVKKVKKMVEIESWEKI